MLSFGHSPIRTSCWNSSQSVNERNVKLDHGHKGVNVLNKMLLIWSHLSVHFYFMTSVTSSMTDLMFHVLVRSNCVMKMILDVEKSFQ